MQATVGSKFQIVIPKEIRKNIKGLKPGSKVSVRTIDEETIAIKTSASDWVERTAGMMTNAWRGIDPIAQVKKGRDEWEERLKRIERTLK